MLSATARPPLPLSPLVIPEVFTDGRTHGYSGPLRTVHLTRVSSNGGGAIAKNDDGTKCVVAGKESLRILHFSEREPSFSEQKFAIGKGGHRIDASHNFWEGSGLKVDSASTDVVWCHGIYNNKILTSARNGEIIMWDLNKSGSAKYERRTKDHLRSIQKMTYSANFPHYCVTGSADGDIRVWDLRTMGKSIQCIHHSASVRSLVFSRSTWKPLQVIVGLDNGSLFRWDLQMARRLGRRVVAHSGSIVALDWFSAPLGHAGDENATQATSGWVASGGLDRCVKIWELPAADSNFPERPSYTLHPSYPVRCVYWRPEYESELAIVSNAEYSRGSNEELLVESRKKIEWNARATGGMSSISRPCVGDALEIWDVRRAWVAKWEVQGSAVEGGFTDIAFADSHAIWAQQRSGTFSQFDLRETVKPLDAIPRVAVAWKPSGTLAFAFDHPKKPWEIPYDDVNPEHRRHADRPKRLGQESYLPTTQCFGSYSDDSGDNWATFETLAKGYMIEGGNAGVICSHNAQVAFRVGNVQAAQVWSLIASLLPGLQSAVPASPPHGSLAPPQSYTLTPSHPRSLEAKNRPARSPSSSRRVTPTSSAPASPKRDLVALTPITSTSRHTPTLPRRDSGDSNSLWQSSTSYRSPSTSTVGTVHTNASHHGEGSRSLRHVGDGALDSSDSSGGEDGTSTTEPKKDGPILQPVIQRVTRTNPSPLSRHGWTDSSREFFHKDERHEAEDEEDASPSPRSTDSEYGSDRGGIHMHRNLKSHQLRTRVKSRTGSSTVASLAASSLRRQESVRTITGQASRKSSFDQLKGEQHRRGSNDPARERDLRRESLDHSQTGSVTRRHNSLTDATEELYELWDEVSGKRQALISADEQAYIKLGWSVVQAALEHFADEGDVQMCAMMCSVVAEKLQVKQQRVICFLESYIEHLHRLQLFTSASNLRKYTKVDAIQAGTMLETVIYSSCARCKKPLIVSVGDRTPRRPPKGGFSFCLQCKSHVVKCAICHLPVRTLLIQCSICYHGGHQECYRRYYMRRPLEELSTSANGTMGFNLSGRLALKHIQPLDQHSPDANRSADFQNKSYYTESKTKMMAHACAAGCGHFCWVASV